MTPMLHVFYMHATTDLWRDHMDSDPDKFTLAAMVFAALGAAFPDIDYVLYPIIRHLGYAGELLCHRGVTHTFAFGLALLAVALIIQKKKQAFGFCLTLFSLGILSHIILDYAFGWPDPKPWVPFWPLSISMSGIRMMIHPEVCHFISASINLTALLSWLIHEEVMRKRQPGKDKGHHKR